MLQKRKCPRGKRKRRARVSKSNQIQNIARLNREEDYDESSGSESDEWYDGDENDEYAYSIGGYYKVAPGDVLKKEYCIKKRLGWGHFSQVYLCQKKSDSEFIAVKIQKTGEDYIKAGNEEVSYHEAINKIETTETHVCRMQNHFEIYSGRGLHVCMTFEIMFSCLYDILDTSEAGTGFPLGVVKAITREVLMGINEIHKAGLIHTDVKPENVMMSAFQPVDTKEFETYRREFEYNAAEIEVEKTKEKLNKGGLNKNQRKRMKAKLAKLEKKLQELTLTLASMPKAEDQDQESKLMALMHIGNSVCENDKANVKLVDLGTACWQHERNDYEIGTRNYRATECLLGHNFGKEIDIWAVACMVVELCNGELLFDPDEEEDEEAFDNDMRNAAHLKQIMQALGKIPGSLRTRNLFNRKGELLAFPDGVEYTGLEELVKEKIPALEMEAIEKLCQFLKPMLEIDPGKRVTAEECLKHEWLQLSKMDKEEVKMWVEDVKFELEGEEDSNEEEEEDSIEEEGDDSVEKETKI